MIEASWGLGEVVVAGRVIPDMYRIARSGEVVERTPGLKKVAVRSLPDGGTVEEEVPRDLVERLCLDDDQLAELNRLAAPLRGGLRSRARHRVGDRRRPALPAPVPRGHAQSGDAGASRSRADDGAPVEAVNEVPLFASLRPDDAAKVARLFKERRFAAGETVTKEGSGAAAFFLIQSGEAIVTVRGEQRAELKAG